MEEAIMLIERVGFPIFIVLGGGYGVYKASIKLGDTTMTFINNLVEENKKDKAVLKQELEFNRQVSTELLATNKLLAQDLTGKVDNLTEKIHNFIETNKK